MESSFNNNPNNNNENLGPEVVVPGINPDRVKTEGFTQEKIKVVEEKAGYEWEPFTDIRSRRESGEIKISPRTPFKSWFKTTLLATLAGIAVTNIGTEYEGGGEKNSIEASIEGLDMEQVAHTVSEDVCQQVDAGLLNRFETLDGQGNPTFNPGGFIIPLAVELNEECRMKTDVEVHIPYHFARTFREIASKNPEQRAEVVERLQELIKSQLRDQITIHGFAGATDSKLVYNRAHNTLSQTPRIDLNDLNISDISVTGRASGEAERSTESPLEDSLTHSNPENQILAGQRLNDTLPLLQEAFRDSGVDPEVINNISSASIEEEFSAQAIDSFAEASDKILGLDVVSSNQERAYTIIQEYNAGNPIVLEAVRNDAGLTELFNSNLDNNRGVDVTFTISADQGRTEVYNIPIALPLLLLLFPLVSYKRGKVTKDIFENARLVKRPEKVRTDLLNIPNNVARRLFSETTPKDLSEQRSFYEVYDDIDLSENSQDTVLLLEHLLIEEVYPSLSEETKEPFIDYEAIVNETRQFLHSDSRKDEVRKGSYGTSDEAEQRMTERLVNMWERHDQATYPMQGIDNSTVINYRHSSSVVYWAKTLAHYFVILAEDTITTTEFRERLRGGIEQMRNNRNQAGGSDKNVFVKSKILKDSKYL